MAPRFVGIAAAALVACLAASVPATAHAQDADHGLELPKKPKAVQPTLSATFGPVFARSDVMWSGELRGKLLFGGLFYTSLHLNGMQGIGNEKSSGALAGIGVGFHIPLGVRFLLNLGVDAEAGVFEFKDRRNNVLLEQEQRSFFVRPRVALGWHFQSNGTLLFGVASRATGTSESTYRYPELFIGAEGF